MPRQFLLPDYVFRFPFSAPHATMQGRRPNISKRYDTRHGERCLNQAFNIILQARSIPNQNNKLNLYLIQSVKIERESHKHCHCKIIRQFLNNSFSAFRQGVDILLTILSHSTLPAS